MSKVIEKYAHLRGIPPVDISEGLPRILIGLQDIHLCAPIESRFGAKQMNLSPSDQS